MYESILLESGKVFIGRRSGIGAKVVDDTEDFTIPVYIPKPKEGKATIISISKPSTFTPGVSFHIKPKMRNDGGDDNLYVKLIDKDTGSVLKDYTSPTILSGNTWEHDMIVTITQETDFHGRIDAGHIE